MKRILAIIIICICMILTSCNSNNNDNNNSTTNNNGEETTSIFIETVEGVVSFTCSSESNYTIVVPNGTDEFDVSSIKFNGTYEIKVNNTDSLLVPLKNYSTSFTLNVSSNSGESIAIHITINKESVSVVDLIMPEKIYQNSNPHQIMVTVVFDDGSKLESCILDLVDKFETSKIGKYETTLEYLDFKKEIDYEVLEDKIVKLVNPEIIVRNYYVGDTCLHTNGDFKIEYLSGIKTYIFSQDDYLVSGFDTTKATSNQKVGIVYNDEMLYSFDIKVHDHKNYDIDFANFKTDYKLGEKFEAGSVTVTYSDGCEYVVNITNDMVSDINFDTTEPQSFYEVFNVEIDDYFINFGFNIYIGTEIIGGLMIELYNSQLLPLNYNLDYIDEFLINYGIKSVYFFDIKGSTDYDVYDYETRQLKEIASKFTYEVVNNFSTYVDVKISYKTAETTIRVLKELDPINVIDDLVYYDIYNYFYAESKDLTVEDFAFNMKIGITEPTYNNQVYSRNLRKDEKTKLFSKCKIEWQLDNEEKLSFTIKYNDKIIYDISCLSLTSNLADLSKNHFVNIFTGFRYYGSECYFCEPIYYDLEGNKYENETYLFEIPEDVVTTEDVLDYIINDTIRNITINGDIILSRTLEYASLIDCFSIKRMDSKSYLLTFEYNGYKEDFNFIVNDFTSKRIVNLSIFYKNDDNYEVPTFNFDSLVDDLKEYNLNTIDYIEIKYSDKTIKTTIIFDEIKEIIKNCQFKFLEYDLTSATIRYEISIDYYGGAYNGINNGYLTTTGKFESYEPFASNLYVTIANDMIYTNEKDEHKIIELINASVELMVKDASVNYLYVSDIIKTDIIKTMKFTYSSVDGLYRLKYYYNDIFLNEIAVQVLADN